MGCQAEDAADDGARALDASLDGAVSAPDGGEGQDATAGGSTPQQPDAGPDATLPCNGSVALCERHYDDVVFAATHNSHSAEEYGYSAFNANQLSGFQKQLDDGIRAFLMDVYEDSGEHVFCHGPCTLGKTSHVEGLTIFAEFLAKHPREVVTFIYEDHLATEQIAADFAESGLDAYVFEHAQGAAWPTLAQLIEQNTRLIVSAENGGPPPAWLHHVWDVAWDTPYEYKSASEFSCSLNRGARDNDLFLVNHWLGNTVGLPSQDGAKEVNAYDVLYTRVRACADEASDVPNFVAVDFYEYGDLFEVVDALNAAGP